MSDYQETIAELRAKAAERELVGYQNRAAELDMEISNLESQAIEAANQGDDALALSYAAEANAKNAEAQQILQQLPQATSILSAKDRLGGAAAGLGKPPAVRTNCRLLAQLRDSEYGRGGR